MKRRTGYKEVTRHCESRSARRGNPLKMFFQVRNSIYKRLSLIPRGIASSFLLAMTFKVVFFLFLGIVYFHNLTRDVYSGDIGDLVTAGYVFGVAHPPGYPLLTFLGFVFSHLFLFLPVVTRVSLVSFFSCLLGVFLFYRFCWRVTKSVFLAMLCSSILAFSYGFWLFVEIPEVFGLNNFFVIALLYLGILFYEERRMVFLYWLAFLSGLSLTNQQQIVVIFPGLAFLVLGGFWRKRKGFAARGDSGLSTLRILAGMTIKLFGLFFLGLIPYLYVPIAARMRSVVNWDNASNWGDFWRLVSRGDYKIFTPHAWFLSFFERIPIVINYFQGLLDNYSFLVVLVFLIGVVVLFKNKRLVLLSLLLAFFIAGPLFVFVIVPPISSSDALGVIQRFYPLSFVVLAFFLPYGFLGMKVFLDRFFSKSSYSILTLSIFLLVPFFMVVYNFPKTDLSRTQIGDTFGRRILSAVPEREILFLHGDNVLFNTWYVHYVLGYKSQVRLVSIGLSGNNYFQQQIVSDYLKSHKKTNLSEDQMIGMALPGLLRKQSIYTTTPLPYPLSRDYVFLPVGMVYQLVHKSELPIRDDYLKRVSPFLRMSFPRRETLTLAEQNLVAPDITKNYSDAFSHIGNFLVSYYGDVKDARVYYEKAVFIDNENSTAYANLASVESLSAASCGKAEGHMRTAIDYYPIFRPYYVALYQIYQRCGGAKEQLRVVAEEYKRVYRRDIEKEPERVGVFY